MDGFDDNNFDVATSPRRRTNNTQYVSGHSSSQNPAQMSMGGAVVPQEQYDALKARFIENETATQMRLESITDLENTIKRREQQLADMEKMYLEKIEAGQKEFEEFKVAARESERHIQGEVKTAQQEKEELVRSHEE